MTPAMRDRFRLRRLLTGLDACMAWRKKFWGGGKDSTGSDGGCHGQHSGVELQVV